MNNSSHGVDQNGNHLQVKNLPSGIFGTNSGKYAVLNNPYRTLHKALCEPLQICVLCEKEKAKYAENVPFATPQKN